jgi:hypothetical protein
MNSSFGFNALSKKLGALLSINIIHDEEVKIPLEKNAF